METVILIAVLLNLVLTLKGLHKAPAAAVSQSKPLVSAAIVNPPSPNGSLAITCTKCGRNVVRYNQNGLCANCANGNL